MMETQNIYDLYLILYLDLTVQITSQKKSAVRRISETQICPKQESITVHEAETYLNLWHHEAYTDDWMFTELLRTHTAHICVPVT